MKRLRPVIASLVPVFIETPSQVEARERLEFFHSLPASEQDRLSKFFAEVFGTDRKGEFKFDVDQRQAMRATA